MSFPSTWIQLSDVETERFATYRHRVEPDSVRAGRLGAQMQHEMVLDPD